MPTLRRMFSYSFDSCQPASVEAAGSLWGTLFSKGWEPAWQIPPLRTEAYR